MSNPPSLYRFIAAVELRGWFFAAFAMGLAAGLLLGLFLRGGA